MRYRNARGFDTKLRQIDRRVNGEMFACRPGAALRERKTPSFNCHFGWEDYGNATTDYPLRDLLRQKGVYPKRGAANHALGA